MTEPMMNRISEAIEDFVSFYAIVMAEARTDKVVKTYNMPNMGNYQVTIERVPEQAEQESAEATIQE